MTQLPAPLSRATDLKELYENPLAFLADARASLGDAFVTREDGQLFSRNPDCAGVVATFGASLTRRSYRSWTRRYGVTVLTLCHTIEPTPTLWQTNETAARAKTICWRRSRTAKNPDHDGSETRAMTG